LVSTRLWIVWSVRLRLSSTWSKSMVGI
jgi:hypothetical protein